MIEGEKAEFGGSGKKTGADTGISHVMEEQNEQKRKIGEWEGKVEKLR